MDDRLVEFEANFSVLDRYGTDVTASEFITNPAIGRDNQIKELILILLTPEKSAILIGKPGIGKTAIVEGLAYRIQKGDVPDALQGYTIINMKTASLLGTMPSGESKVQKMIDELKTREKVILFIDEIHMLIGATDSSALDFANIFKEGLGRGSIKVIGATTTEEYERYVLRDKAFTRRFQKVEVPEPTREETIEIMMGTLPKFEKQTGRKMKYTSFIKERIMAFLVDITSEYKRVFALGSRYPDVCLTLLKQAFSYTVFDNREYMDIFDVRKAIENSKNIYPDVIKKELPRFDSEFHDIILEERGEKPVEEWRRESGPTRYEHEQKKLAEQQEEAEKPLDRYQEALKNLDAARSEISQENHHAKIPTKLSEETKKKFAKVGPTVISKGYKDQFNRQSDSNNIDQLLLSNGIGVIGEEEEVPSLPVNYTFSDDLLNKPDELILGTPIISTLDHEPSSEDEPSIYRSDNLIDRELNPKSHSLILDNEDERMNFDREKSRASRADFSPLNISAEKKSTEEDNLSSSESQSYSTKNNEFLFGAPMYSEEEKEEEKKVNTDVFGQLITDHMQIKNGKLIELPSSMTKLVRKDPKLVEDVSHKGEKKEQNSLFFTNSSKESFDDLSKKLPKTDEKVEEDISQDSISVLPPEKNDLEEEKSPREEEIDYEASLNKLNFLMGTGEYSKKERHTDEKKPEKESFFWKEEKPLRYKEEEVALDSLNPQMENEKVSISNTDRFVDLSDLNSGKISPEEVNQYISPSQNLNDTLQTRENTNLEFERRENPVPTLDLTLKDVPEQEDYFDDFYDE